MDTLAKLRIKQELPLYLIDMPKDLPGVFVHPDIKISLADKEPIKQVVFFALDKKRLDAKIDAIAARLAKDTVCWIAYPKKSGKIQSDLIRDEGWEKVCAAGLDGVSSASINDDWSGMRFKLQDPNATSKGAVPMNERKTEGVDYVNRTVKLPKDASDAMKPYKGLEAFFYSMSFTHTREYIEAITDAKKSETRERRIANMVEEVLKLKTLKGGKKK